MLRWLLDAVTALRTQRTSGRDRLVYQIEAPTLSQLRPGVDITFRGWSFWYGKRRVRNLLVTLDDDAAGSFPVAQARADLASYVPHLPAAAHCGFTARLVIPHGARRLGLAWELDDGTHELLADCDLDHLWAIMPELLAAEARIAGIPAPAEELIQLTQGNRLVELYQASRLATALSMEDALTTAGVASEKLRNLLDFGCGTGRVLLGWYARDPRRSLTGCDVNPALVAWARECLPEGLEVFRNEPLPPLPLATGISDLVTMISVFTHLSLESQREWVAELHRVLRPGGVLLVTLHNESYVRHVFWDDPSKPDELRREGHLQRVISTEGGNDFASFHTRGFAQKLFAGFDLLAHFPNGRLAGRRPLYQIALMQDVYVFRRSD